MQTKRRICRSRDSLRIVPSLRRWNADLSLDTTPPTIGQAGADQTIQCPDTPVFTQPTASNTCGGATVNGETRCSSEAKMRWASSRGRKEIFRKRCAGSRWRKTNRRALAGAGYPILQGIGSGLKGSCLRAQHVNRSVEPPCDLRHLSTSCSADLESLWNIRYCRFAGFCFSSFSAYPFWFQFFPP